MPAQAANALPELVVTAGDRATVYMPMIPEAVVTMLAVVRLGAVHSVVFAGFSADALSSRILDSDCQVGHPAVGEAPSSARPTRQPATPSSRWSLSSCQPTTIPRTTR